MRILILLLALTLLASAGCDRNLEPFDPDEKPHEPDLSKIFPEGADQAARLEPGLPPAPGGGRAAPPLASAADRASAAPIHGRVELAPELAAAAPDTAVLFIIGRHGSGGPPLAVKRVPRPRFPLAFTLGPEDRMIQSMPFAGPITLTVRLDSDGNATSSAPGDLTGTASTPVEPGATDVVVVLDTLI